MLSRYKDPAFGRDQRLKMLDGAHFFGVTAAGKNDSSGVSIKPMQTAISFGP